MNRRTLLLALVATALLPRWVGAEQNHKLNEWRVPGGNSYTGTFEQALRQLSARGLIPQEVQNALRQKVEAGEYTDDVIPEDYRFTRMVFGKGQVTSNLIAKVSVWPANKTRKAQVYRYKYGEHWYVLIRPEVCNNWSIRITTPQGVCIPDVP